MAALVSPDAPAQHTPLMRQWLSFKENEARDLILFFRVGDFYELFWEDAERASKLLDLTLTRRGSSGGREIKMSGVPWHALDLHLSRLLRMGHGAAVVDQIGDPALSKGPVERALTRLITPGTLLDDALLDDKRDAPLVAIIEDPKRQMAGLFWMSLSSGCAFYTLAHQDELADELARIEPAEVLLPEGAVLPPGAPACTITRLPSWRFDTAGGRERLLEHFSVANLDGFGPLERQPLVLAAACAAYSHAQASLGNKRPNLLALRESARSQHVELDGATRRALEITVTQNGKSSPTLFSELDECVSPMGSRRLRQWISEPPACVNESRSRLGATRALAKATTARETLRSALHGMADIERASARAAAGLARPRDFFNLREALQSFAALREQLTPLAVPVLTLPQEPGVRTPDARSQTESSELESLSLDHAEGAHASGIQSAQPLTTPHGEPTGSRKIALLLNALAEQPQTLAFLQTTIAADPSVHLRDGGVIASGHSAELDRLRAASVSVDAALAEMQERERTLTGIATLRIEFNRAHGFQIEIPRSQASKAPERYVRKQTLKAAERFVTTELADLEKEVLGAQDRASKLEKDLFEQAQAQLASMASELARASRAVGELDALLCFAHVAVERGYCEPVFTVDGSMRVEQARHPVVERIGSERFVPNDIEMDPQRRTLLITGPNMGGKSTYMRAAGLIALMARAGSFVPADSCALPPISRICARVGSGDDIARNRSTFMVEMAEAAAILRHADARTLCLIDEIGRGTSTYDGMALAWATLRHLTQVNGGLTLFSTHYLELAELAQTLPGVANVHLDAEKTPTGIIFLRKLKPGAANQSHGIEVARLAGVPTQAIDWAQSLLNALHGQSAPKLIDALTKAQQSGTDLATEAASLLAQTQQATVQVQAQIHTQVVSDAQGHAHPTGPALVRLHAQEVEEQQESAFSPERPSIVLDASASTADSVLTPTPDAIVDAQTLAALALREQLLALQPDEMTPKMALEALYALRLAARDHSRTEDHSASLAPVQPLRKSS